MSVVSGFFKSFAGVLSDAVNTAAAPVKLNVDIVREITKPLAETAREIADLAVDRKEGGKRGERT